MGEEYQFTVDVARVATSPYFGIMRGPYLK
jgi:hypothetical protein